MPVAGQKEEQQQSHLLDLLEINLGATSISSPPLGAIGGINNTDPWGASSRAASQLSDPWSGTSSPPIDPWHPTQANRVNNMPNMALGAVGGNVNNTDAWTMRTQSPSLASGSSTEGWLATNGAVAAAGNVALMNGNGGGLASDPWLSGGAGAAAAATGSIKPALASAPLVQATNIDPWISDSQKPVANVAPPAREDPWAAKTLATQSASAIDDPWKALETTEKVFP